MHDPIGFACRGLGRYLPANACPSLELDKKFGKPEGWTEDKFGIRSRHVANRDETTSIMAAHACREALSQAGWQDGQFDVLVGACGVMEQPIPSTSALVQYELGLKTSGIPCFDVNMTCLSFLAALDQISLGMKVGRYKRAVIFSSDIASAGLNYEDPEVSAIFGDGAAALCIEAVNGEAAILATRFATLSAGKDLAHLRAGGTKLRLEDGLEALSEGARFHMDPFGIFKAAGRHLPKLINDTLSAARLSMDEIHTVICHQASAPAIEYMRHLMKTRPDRLVDIFADQGNLIAASIPSSLYSAFHQGRLAPGTNTLVVGTSAGVSMGAMVLRF